MELCDSTNLLLEDAGLDVWIILSSLLAHVEVGEMHQSFASCSHPSGIMYEEN
jgi:hypothetical protein